MKRFLMNTAAVVLVLAGFARSPAQFLPPNPNPGAELVGTWVNNSNTPRGPGQLVWSFRPDGSYSLELKQGGQVQGRVEGRYTYANQVLSTVTTQGEANQYQVRLAQNQMQCVFVGGPHAGQAIVFTRDGGGQVPNPGLNQNHMAPQMPYPPIQAPSTPNVPAQAPAIPTVPHQVPGNPIQPPVPPQMGGELVGTWVTQGQGPQGIVYITWKFEANGACQAIIANHLGQEVHRVAGQYSYANQVLTTNAQGLVEQHQVAVTPQQLTVTAIAGPHAGKSLVFRRATGG